MSIILIHAWGFVNTSARVTPAASVILRSEATKNPKPLRDCCASWVHLDAHRPVDWHSRLNRNRALPSFPPPSGNPGEGCRHRRRPWILHCVQNDRRARTHVILRSEATKNPKPLCEYCVYILTNETHSLHMESESPGLIDLSAEWSEALDSSLRSE